MCALWEPLGDIGKIEMSALLFICLFIYFFIYLLLSFRVHV